jgi:hypothetical protein
MTMDLGPGVSKLSREDPRSDLRKEGLAGTGYGWTLAADLVTTKSRQRTNARAPEDLDIAVGLEPDLKLVASEQPQPSPPCGFAQHILVDLAKIGYRSQGRPDISHDLGVVVVVNNIASSDGESGVRELDAVGVGEHCGRPE